MNTTHEPLAVGDRVSWPERGKLRTGTVINAGHSEHALIHTGRNHYKWVSKSKLTRLAPQEQP